MTHALRDTRFWLLALAVVVNLGFAAPAVAEWKNGTCEDPETGDVYSCCTSCIFFCHCDYLPPQP